MTNYRLKSADINLRDEIALIIRKEFDFAALVTVVKVVTAGDFRNIKAYISVMPAKDFKKVATTLKKSASRISYQLAQRVRIKYIPRILFFRDEGGVNSRKVEKIIAKFHDEKSIPKEI
jgi:ribosome-binding factor A